MGSRHRTPTVQNKNATRDIQGKVSCRLSVIILKCQTHRPFHRSARPPTTIVFHSGSSSRPCFIYVQHPARVSTILQFAFTKTVVRASVAFFVFIHWSVYITLDGINSLPQHCRAWRRQATCTNVMIFMMRDLLVIEPIQHSQCSV